MRAAKGFLLSGLLLAPTFLSAFTGPTILVKKVGTSIWDELVNCKYQTVGKFGSIRNVDFKELKLVLFDAYGPATANFQPEDYQQMIFQLRNGKYYAPDPSETDRVFLDHVEYFGGSHADKALLSLHGLSCGASCSEEGEIVVFALRNGSLFETQEIIYDFQAPGAGASFSPNTGALTISGRYQDLSGHCCPDKLEVATFQWDGNRFSVKQG